MANPMPDPAPVTTATLFASSNIPVGARLFHIAVEPSSKTLAFTLTLKCGFFYPRNRDDRIRLASNLRDFPSKVAGLRSPFLNLWDISIIKQVPLSGHVRAQFNIEFLNAFNHPVVDNPNTDPTNANSGKVTNQANLPRDIQIAAKIVF